MSGSVICFPRPGLYLDYLVPGPFWALPLGRVPPVNFSVKTTLGAIHAQPWVSNKEAGSFIFRLRSESRDFSVKLPPKYRVFNKLLEKPRLNRTIRPILPLVADLPRPLPSPPAALRRAVPILNSSPRTFLPAEPPLGLCWPLNYQLNGGMGGEGDLNDSAR